MMGDSSEKTFKVGSRKSQVNITFANVFMILDNFLIFVFIPVSSNPNESGDRQFAKVASKFQI